MFYFFDPVYLLVIGVGFVLSALASAVTKGTFNRYSRIPTQRRMTGADVAQRILQDNNIHDVTIEPVRGKLTDHYDPRSKTLRLSEPVYGGQSISAAGVAAHEVGHAIQHARGYAPLRFRSWWVPMAGFGTNIGIILIFVAMMLGGVQHGGMGFVLAWVGLGLFACSTVFTLVTLPVEFDASRRAMVTLEGSGFLSREELSGARKVLTAAAMTYVAAFISSLMILLYYAARLGLLGNRSD